MSINKLLMPRYKWFGLVFIAGFFAAPSFAQTAEEKGLEIAKQKSKEMRGGKIR